MLLQNFGTGLCADMGGFGAGTVNGPVNQYYCQPGSGDNQMWSLQVVSGPRGPEGESCAWISAATAVTRQAPRCTSMLAARHR